MKDPSAAAFQAAIKAPKFPQEEQHLRCPRCDSTNTKFCYYNNYNLSQPRHFCKDCRRYWTKGGALRNIPVGGGTRKNSKRSAPSSSSSSSHTKRSISSPSPAAATHAAAEAGETGAASSMSTLQFPKLETIPSVYSSTDADRQLLDFTGSFSSLLTSHGHFGSLLDSFHAGGRESSGYQEPSTWEGRSGILLSTCTAPAMAET
ncbi:unnamed protein product [Spirodela intermedia]|uniref:Dof zinc finger protein n=1 Tax=Spirodela intermedia TaxID=51605 RepID=A0A7I8J7B2_SPIIN|nr:unnamed protein product [Spirodela intermedia]CAA6666107.1 unnamed protein product [Spirodela intermedia]